MGWRRHVPAWAHDLMPGSDLRERLNERRATQAVASPTAAMMTMTKTKQKLRFDGLLRCVSRSSKFWLQLTFEDR